MPFCISNVFSLFRKYISMKKKSHESIHTSTHLFLFYILNNRIWIIEVNGNIDLRLNKYEKRSGNVTLEIFCGYLHRMYSINFLFFEIQLLEIKKINNRTQSKDCAASSSPWIKFKKQ